MIETTYQKFPGEVIILGLPAFVKLLNWQKSNLTMFFKTSPVTKIHPNGDFETKDEFLYKGT